jgi:hypothetical protein
LQGWNLSSQRLPNHFLALIIYLMSGFDMHSKPAPDKRDTRCGAVVLARLGMITTSLTLVAFGPSRSGRSQAGLFRS